MNIENIPLLNDLAERVKECLKSAGVTPSDEHKRIISEMIATCFNANGMKDVVTTAELIMFVTGKTVKQLKGKAASIKDTTQ